MHTKGDSVALDALTLHGVSHRRVGVSVREKLALNHSKSDQALDVLLQIPGVNEAVVLSTCNRVEVVVAGQENDIKSEIKQFFEGISGVSQAEFNAGVYHYQGDQAVNHLFRVASGLDSLVLGEPQVLGQVKSAYLHSLQRGGTKTILNKLFHRAFGVAKSVRTNTGIGRNAVSVCYAGRELAKQIFGELNDIKVMMIGAGEMGVLSLKHFQAEGVSTFYIVNKSAHRAAGVAEIFGGVALGFHNFEQFLPEADIVIGVATIAPGDQALVSYSAVEKAQKKRWAEPQFFIDLSVPRVIDEKIETLDDAFLYNIDDLEGVVQNNMDSRKLEVSRAEILITEEVKKFTEWMSVRLTVDPVIKQVVERFDFLSRQEIGKTLKRMEKVELSTRQKEELFSALNDLSKALIAKALHRPISELKRHAREDHELLDLLMGFLLDRDL